MKVKVHNLIILDESGSMESIQKPAVDGLNETLQAIQSAQKTHHDLQEHFVTMVFFNSDGIRTILENKPIEEVKMLKQTDFLPNSCTPLYDAMGTSFSRLRSIMDDNVKNQVLVTIITDGYENASREYTGKMIKKMVDELKASGWVFAYIGANQNVDEVADALSVDNRMSFDADYDGSVKMSMRVSQSRTNFYQKLSRSLSDDSINLQEDFFKEE